MKSHDHMPESVAQRQPVAEAMRGSRSGHPEIDGSARMVAQCEQINAAFGQGVAQAQEDTDRGGLPGPLKAGLETLSGMDMSDVRVHANSSRPAQLNALAYAQGNDIHLAPGQEQHLPHEAWHLVQQRQGRVAPTMQMEGVAINDDASLEAEADRMGAQAVQAAGRPVQAKRHAAAAPGVFQLVNAYRIEYQHNRKVETGKKGGVTGLRAPIDISFVMPDHSEYFARERSPDQLTGLRRVQWEMNDDWWTAVQYVAKGGKKPTGKAAAKLEKMDKFGKPSWSDGNSISKFIKQTALHFDDSWNDSLNKAIVKGTGQVEDLEAEYRAEAAEREKQAKEKEASKPRKPGDQVVIRPGDAADDPDYDTPVSYQEFLDDYEEHGYVIVS